LDNQDSMGVEPYGGIILVKGDRTFMRHPVRSDMGKRGQLQLNHLFVSPFVYERLLRATTVTLVKN